jgi:hypothetical protein
MKSVIFLAITLILIIPSCKKEKVYNLTEKEKLLTSHGWKISSIGINGIVGTLNPWQLDDCWVFREDGTCTYYHGTFKNPTLKEYDATYLWELSNDEKFLIYAMATPSIDISTNEMVLTYIVDNGDIRVYTYVPC